MTVNLGRTDRIIRIVAGVAILSLLALLDSGARWLGLIGLVPLVSAFVGWCPAYALFGLSTCARPDSEIRSATIHRP